MSDDQGSGWPRFATEEELEALRPGSEDQARTVARHILDGRRSGLAEPGVSPRVRLAYALVRAFEDDPLLQELGQNELETDDALRLAGEIIEVMGRDGRG